jgi:hypothetical protein
VLKYKEYWSNEPVDVFVVEAAIVEHFINAGFVKFMHTKVGLYKRVGINAFWY